ncbi:Polyol transporter 5 [Linum grandiflorum]
MAGLTTDNVMAPPRNKFIYVCVAFASMTSVLLGYDIGVMSGAIIYIKEQFRISDGKIEILVGLLNIYSLIGSFIAGRVSDRIGRRKTIVVAAAIFFVGSLLMGLATSYAFLMVGRFVAGIGVGFGCMIAPVYTAELSPAASRGFLTSFPEVFVNVGILLGFLSNYIFSKLPHHLGWRLMLGVGAIPSIFLGVSVLRLPESPRWLVVQGRHGDAKRVLLKICTTPDEAEDRLKEIKEAAGIPENLNDEVVEVDERSPGEAVWKELVVHPTRPVRHILLCAVGIHFFQQGVGLDAVLLYSPRIFNKAGFTSFNQQLLATVAVGLVKTVFIVVASFLLDRVGRRPLLLGSFAGIVASLATLGMTLTVIGQDPTRKIKWAVGVCLTSVLSAVAFFSIGAGPVTGVYSTEILPLRLRAQGMSLAMGTNRVVSGVITMTFLTLSKAITIGGSFFLFAGISSVGFFFFYMFYPETQGKTLEEIEGLFGNFLRWRSADLNKSDPVPAGREELEGGLE